MDWKLTCCYKCGYFDEEAIDLDCIWCGGEGTVFEVDDKSINNMTLDELESWKQNFIKNEIFNNPLFDKDTFNKRISHSLDKSKQDKVSCPKCGSTQIQAVNKKWSLLTGFLTNKTQRFCLNCKYKW